MSNPQMTDNPDLANIRATIQRFISGKLMQSGAGGYVIGLSGGIDSALAVTLAVAAVGNDKVLGVILPYKTSSPESRTDAVQLVEQLKIEHRAVDISPMVDAYFPTIDDSLKIRAGNKMARERMAVLFDIAQETGRLVMGTGNRTEICLGYTTWYGDSACSMNPIGELYKTEVRALAELVGVPENIRQKAPSADLWVEQTDEGEIGVTYETIDKILRRLVDDEIHSMQKLVDQGFDETDVSRVVSLLNRNAFKRRQPEVAPLGRSAVPDYIQLAE